jgi:PAS domain-containing protein
LAERFIIQTIEKIDKIKLSFQSGEVWKTAFLARADGIYRWFLSGLYLFATNGAVIRWFGTNTDTTEIKEAEEKLVEYQQS